MRDKLELALADFNSAINLRPNNPQFLIFRGMIYSKAKRFNEAIADYNRVISLDKKSSGNYLSRAYLNRGDIYLAMKDLNQAKSDYSIACQLGLDTACNILNKF